MWRAEVCRWGLGGDSPYQLMEPFLRTRGILYWRREPGAPGEDMGTAWVIEPDGMERPVNGGDPISRSEAERLARAGEHMLDAEP